MDLYRKLAKNSTFSIKDMEELGINKKTSYYFLDSMMKKELVKKIRNNIYSIIDPSKMKMFQKQKTYKKQEADLIKRRQR